MYTSVQVHTEGRAHSKRSLANEPKRFRNVKKLGHRRQWARFPISFSIFATGSSSRFSRDPIAIQVCRKCLKALFQERPCR